MEMGARGGNQASDGKQDTLIQNTDEMRCRYLTHTHMHGYLHIYTTSTFVISVMTRSRLHLLLIYFDVKPIVPYECRLRIPAVVVSCTEIAEGKTVLLPLLNIS